MPFDIPFQVKRLSRDVFAKLDFEVMKHAFACHHDLGLLCDEKIYQADLAARLLQAGFDTQREARVLVRHKDFVKEYIFDLLVINGAIYELKAVSAIVPDHDTQLMNYLFIADIKHGKIINFRPASVQSRFVNNAVSHEEQRRFAADTNRWKRLTDRCDSVQDVMQALCTDWGTFLESRLYRDALTHFLGGAQTVIQPVTLKRGSILLGQQSFHLLSKNVAFQITTASARQHLINAQLQRLLNLTPLQAIQWINLSRHTLQFATITRS